MRFGQARKHVALVRRVLVKDVDIASNQSIDSKARQLFLEILFSRCQQLANSFVHIDDIQLAVGYHHVCLDACQCCELSLCAAPYQSNHFIPFEAAASR